MLDALPFTDQARAGDRAVVQRASAPGCLTLEFVGKRVQAFHRVFAQAAIGQFLDAIGEPVFEEAAVIGRRLAVEEVAPFLLESATGAVFRAANCAKTVSGISTLPVDGRRMTALDGR